ncbi:MAG: LPXTG cell wall anchor domain-containing protein [Actinobacteria bacterium]|nr:LPXTG cell wall anchor domain-containing protein [Actinomycetota bacterium]
MTRRSERARWGAWMLLAALTGATLALGAPAGAQEGEEGEPEVHLTLTAITSTVGDGTRPEDAAPTASADDLHVRVLVENLDERSLQDLTLAVEVFRAASTRSDLHRALDAGARPPGLLDAEYADIGQGGELGPGELASVAVTIPASAIGWGPGTGVHPVLIQVLRGTETLDQVTTGVIHLDAAPRQPLPLMVGWPLDAAPRTAIADRFAQDAVDAVLPGGRLERLVWAVEQSPDTPVQVLAGAHLLEDLAAMSDGFGLEVPGGDPVAVPDDDPRASVAEQLLDRIRALAAADEEPVLAGPYADVELGALHGAGFTLEAVRDVTEGRSRLEAVLGERPRPDTMWATTPLSSAVLREVLGPAGVDRIVVSWDQLSGDGQLPDRTPAPFHELRSGGVELAAAVADPWLEDLLADLPTDHGPAVAVQRILAETAQTHLEAPQASDGRGVVLLPGRGWEPSPRAAADLLSALSRAPWIRPLGIDELERVYGVAPQRSTLSADAPTMPEVLGERLAREQAQLAALRDAVTESVDRVGGHGWDDIDTAIRRVPSGWWLTGRTDVALGLLEEVETTLDAGFGSVRLPPDAQVTLTDTEGRIPITLSRPHGPPIQVVVELDAPKLDMAEDARLVTLTEGGQQTISFAAVAQASGRIPVTVRVKTPGAIDPAGSPWVELAAETLVVRSTAISGTALVIVGIVLLALLGWWFYRRRRPPSPQLTVVRDEAA